MRIGAILLGASAFLLLSSGCVHRVGDFTVASSKNMDIGKSLHRVDTNVRKVGTHTQHTFIVFSTAAPDMKEAVDNAIERAPGAVGLSNATIKRGYLGIPLIYVQDWFEVEGNPIYEVGVPTRDGQLFEATTTENAQKTPSRP